jgi:hypothetical protein
MLEHDAPAVLRAYHYDHDHHQGAGDHRVHPS